MNRRVYGLAGVGACVLIAGLGTVVSASEGTPGSIWQHFAVRQTSHQITDPFEEEPGAPVRQPLAVEPAELMPPDPAYQVPATPPRVQPPSTPRVQPPTPLIPPEADVPPVPQPPALPPRSLPYQALPPAEEELWQPGCSTDSCYSDDCAGCCEAQTCSPFRSFFCEALRRARDEDCNPCEIEGLRNGGLPLGIRWEGWLAQGATLNTRSPGNRS
ncbi:MAG: hypothetical protein U1E05_06660, partial [Patescibacteria group bacterium]|nr:hypothetical protein [Patescibacteria group bacterium]